MKHRDNASPWKRGSLGFEVGFWLIIAVMAAVSVLGAIAIVNGIQWIIDNPEAIGSWFRRLGGGA